MWNKVTTKQQLANLSSGDAIIKYPIKGGVQATFHGANPDNISPRVVSDNTGDALRLGFLNSDRRNDPILGMYKSVFGPVEKSYDDIIAEGLWWVYEG